jgi:hypothetical protein
MTAERVPLWIIKDKDGRCRGVWLLPKGSLKQASLYLVSGKSNPTGWPNDSIIGEDESSIVDALRKEGFTVERSD